MPNTYSSLLVHVVFSTKKREPWLTPEILKRLDTYVSGIAKQNGFAAIAVGGVKDHVHVLLSVPPVVSVAKAVQLIKGGTSKWISETFPYCAKFAWQSGYGAFTIGVSMINVTVAYIKKQEEHHRAKTFREEYEEFMKRHGIEYDEKYLVD